MPEANESIKPFTLLGGILYLDEFELLPGLSANACRNIGRLRRKAVSAHLVGDRKTVISCARQINRVVEADKRRRERLSSKKVGRHRNRNLYKRRRTLVPDTMPNTGASGNSSCVM